MPFLQQGDRYRLYDPTNLKGDPIVTGVVEGEQIEVPTEGEFTAFVVFRERP